MGGQAECAHPRGRSFWRTPMSSSTTANSELAVLGLVGRHVGRVAVLSSVLEEARDLTAAECKLLGIGIIEVGDGSVAGGHGDRVEGLVQ